MSNATLLFSVPIILFCLAMLLLFFGWQQFSPLLADGCSALLNGSPRCVTGMDKIRVYALALALFRFILLLERRWPADPRQTAFSPGLVTDAWWFLFFPLLGVWLPTVFEELLHRLTGSTLDGLRWDVFGTLPVTLQVAAVFLFSDFMAYISHLVRHKVSWMWEFHKIHHSQEQLNYFSTVRLHPLDLIAGSLIRFLPFTLLGGDIALTAFLGWIAFQRFYEMFVHANLRTNLGWLRYVLVTPQSHRIHHSLQREHIDTNYGNIFSIWDFMFGTQVRDYDAYPPLGVHDPDVPRNTSTGIWAGARTFARELVYPLIALTKPKR